MDLRELPASPFERHPWETVRAKFFCDVVTRLTVLRDDARILDIGSGDAFLARRLARSLSPAGHLICFDVHYTEDHVAKLRAESPHTLTYTASPPSGTFDLVLLLDVLEHVSSDEEFLRQTVDRYLRSDGAILISVPAWPRLYTSHDVLLGHHRRYDRAALASVADACGLEPMAGGGLFYSLLTIRALQKLHERARGIHATPDPERFAMGARTAVGEWNQGRLATTALGACLALDARLSLSVSLALSARCIPGLSAWGLYKRR